MSIDIVIKNVIQRDIAIIITNVSQRNRGALHLLLTLSGAAHNSKTTEHIVIKLDGLAKKSKLKWLDIILFTCDVIVTQ